MIAVAGGIVLAVFILLMLAGLVTAIRDLVRFVSANLTAVALVAAILLLAALFGTSFASRPTSSASPAAGAKPVLSFDGSHIVCIQNCN